MELMVYVGVTILESKNICKSLRYDNKRRNEFFEEIVDEVW